MGYNHYRYARKVGADIHIGFPDVAYPRLELGTSPKAKSNTNSLLLLYKTGTFYMNLARDTGYVEISAQQTNDDILLTPNGTGKVRFGTHSPTGDVPSNGHMTIKDDAGGTIKLMTKA